MRKLLPALLLIAFLTSPSKVSRATAPIVVDHTSVALFESIPETYLTAAHNLNMLWLDQSVGGNIDDGLVCLSYASDEAAPSRCKKYTHQVPAYSVPPSEVNWAHPGGYNRSNWVYQFFPGNCSDYWYNVTACFISTPITGYAVASFQFSYLQVQAGSSISGFFLDNPTKADVYDLAAYEAAHPGVTVIYWTTSLARGIGSAESEAFNAQMRAYAAANNKILFDVADIESHDVAGLPCYDNRDGIAYQSENYPNDGLDYAAICQQYTSEVDGGHLGSVSAGKIRIAKAFWVLMARIAGWEP